MYAFPFITHAAVTRWQEGYSRRTRSNVDTASRYDPVEKSVVPSLKSSSARSEYSTVSWAAEGSARKSVMAPAAARRLRNIRIVIECSKDSFSLNRDLEFAVHGPRMARLDLEGFVECSERLSRLPPMQAEVAQVDPRVNGTRVQRQRFPEIGLCFLEPAHSEEHISAQLPRLSIVRINVDGKDHVLESAIEVETMHGGDAEHPMTSAAVRIDTQRLFQLANCGSVVLPTDQELG